MTASPRRARPAPPSRSRRPSKPAPDALDRAFERVQAVRAILRLALAAIQLPWDAPAAQLARAEVDARVAALKARIAAEDAR